MKKRAIVLTVLALVLVVLVFGSSWVGSAKAEQKKQGGTLRLVLGTNPDTLDSDRTRVVEAASITNGNIVEALVRMDANHELRPCLAESWKVLDGGRALEFYLRKGVKFHDGSFFDAEVVKWNFDRALDAKIGWPGGSSWRQTIESYNVIDQYTFRVNLKQQMGAWIRTPFTWLGSGKMMQSRMAVEKWGKDYGRHPVGTGPLKFVEWVDNDHITLERNKGYWEKGLPYVDKVIYRVTPDVNVRMQALRAGEIDLFRHVPVELITLVKTNSKLKYGVREKGKGFEFLLFNTKKKPFDDRRVRQAIGFAINRNEIVDLLLPGLAVADANFVANGNYFYHDVGFFKYDPERAKNLLKEAGVEKLSFDIKTNNSYPHFVKTAELIQEQLGKIGIEARITVLDKGYYWRKIFTKEYDVAHEDWESAVDPSEYIGILTLTTSRYNASGYSNPEFDDLMAKALVPSDPAQRKVLYVQAQDIVVKDAPLLALFHRSESVAMQKYVMGAEDVPLAANYQCGRYIWLNK